MHETDLAPLNWNTVTAMVLMVISTVGICIWAAYDFSLSDRPTQVAHVAGAGMSSSSQAAGRHGLGVNLGMILQSNPSLSSKDKTTLSIEEIELEMGQGLESDLERHRPYKIRLPRSRTLPNTPRMKDEQSQVRRRQSLIHVMHERAIQQKTSSDASLAHPGGMSSHERIPSTAEPSGKSEFGMYKGRPVPGLPHPKKSILLPSSAHQHARPRRDYAGKGKFPEHSGYVEERDEGLLSRHRSF